MIITDSNMTADEFISKLADALADRIVKANNVEEQPLSIEQIADRFGVEVRTIYDWNVQGCPHTKTKPAQFYLSEVKEWLKVKGKFVNRRARRLAR